MTTCQAACLIRYLATGMMALGLSTSTQASEPRGIPRASVAPVIDGVADDPAWALAEWRELDQLWLGASPLPEDFSGRYKLVWTPEKLWLLAEIVDDFLVDTHPDPLERYWEDDALEFFLDEDASGGNHQFDHNAFAQHISLDNQSVDIAPVAGGSKPALFPDMVEARWRRSTEAPYALTWEVAIAVFDDSYHQDPKRTPPSPVTLEAGKVMGFMLGYCDADSAGGREHFIGDVAIEPVDGDRNRGYIDASVFAPIKLLDAPAQPEDDND